MLPLSVLFWHMHVFACRFMRRRVHMCKLQTILTGVFQ